MGFKLNGLRRRVKYAGGEETFWDWSMSILSGRCPRLLEAQGKLLDFA